MRLSAIGRPVDPRYPTNVAIIAISGMAFVGALLATWLQGSMDVGWAGRVAATGFLAWAIARELDPDHPLSAFLGAAIALGISSIALPSLLFSFWALLVLRVLNQSPGTPTLFDGIITIVLALWASFQGFWITAPLTALAFLADGRLPKPTDRWKLAPLPLLGLVWAWPVTLGWHLSWLHVAIVFALPLLLAKQVTSVCDQGTPLMLRRVQAAVALAAFIVLAAPETGAAIAAALLGAGAWRVGLIVATKGRG